MSQEMYTFYFPDIGEGVVEGEVLEWLKKVGDPIAQDEPVVVVMTDKATVELPAPHPGTLAKQYYSVGQMAMKDRPLYDIAVTEKLPEGVKRVEEKIAVSRAQEERKPVAVAQGKALAVPKVRGIAKELGIDLGSIRGSGKDGRVVLEDLRGGIARDTVSHGDEDTVQPLTGMRGVMARKMDLRHVPQFSYFEHVEVTHLMRLRHHLQEKAHQEDLHLSYMPFFLRALSLTMEKFPIINSSVDMAGNHIIYHKHHNIGIATASPQGLLVPVLSSVETLKFEDLVHAYEELKGHVIGGKVPPERLKGATISISNFGVLGGEGMWATPLINPPEVAILAVARMRKEPVVRNQEVVVRDVLPLSWSFDHRIIDGELAAAISHHYCHLLRSPATML